MLSGSVIIVWYVIDGIDGSGKTTTALAVKSILESKGHTVTMFSHPDRNHLCGKLCGRYLTIEGNPAKILSTSFFILSVIGSLFRMKRCRTDDVIFVRYTMSVCYVPEKLVKRAYRLFTAILPKPDMLILKDVEEEDAVKRIGRRGDDVEVFENLESLRETRRKMMLVSDGWHIVNAKYTVDEVESYLRTIIA